MFRMIVSLMSRMMSSSARSWSFGFRSGLGISFPFDDEC
jgi:hypothetical protein